MVVKVLNQDHFLKAKLTIGKQLACEVSLYHTLPLLFFQLVVLLLLSTAGGVVSGQQFISTGGARGKPIITIVTSASALQGLHGAAGAHGTLTVSSPMLSTTQVSATLNPAVTVSSPMVVSARGTTLTTEGLGTTMSTEDMDAAALLEQVQAGGDTSVEGLPMQVDGACDDDDDHDVGFLQVDGTNDPVGEGEGTDAIPEGHQQMEPPEVGQLDPNNIMEGDQPENPEGEAPIEAEAPPADVDVSQEDKAVAEQQPQLQQQPEQEEQAEAAMDTSLAEGGDVVTPVTAAEAMELAAAVPPGDEQMEDEKPEVKDELPPITAGDVAGNATITSKSSSPLKEVTE